MHPALGDVGIFKGTDDAQNGTASTRTGAQDVVVKTTARKRVDLIEGLNKSPRKIVITLT